MPRGIPGSSPYAKKTESKKTAKKPAARKTKSVKGPAPKTVKKTQKKG
jgi:hypothetical protein